MPQSLIIFPLQCLISLIYIYNFLYFFCCVTLISSCSANLYNCNQHFFMVLSYDFPKEYSRDNFRFVKKILLMMILVASVHMTFR